MKKLFVFFIAVSLFTACKNDKNGKAEKDKMDTKKDDYNDQKMTDDKDKTTNETESTTASWNNSDEDKFMTSCEGTATPKVGEARAKEYCDCMLQKLKKMYSSYAEADSKLANASQEEVQRLATDCNGGQ